MISTVLGPHLSGFKLNQIHYILLCKWHLISIKISDLVLGMYLNNEYL